VMPHDDMEAVLVHGARLSSWAEVWQKIVLEVNLFAQAHRRRESFQAQNVLASIDRFVPLRALDRSNLHRQRVHRPSITCPRRKIEMPTGGDFVKAHAAKRERGIWLAYFGRLCGTKKVSASPGAHRRGFAIRLHKHRRAFVNRNFAGSSRPSVMSGI
jgi:hypothetical protein